MTLPKQKYREIVCQLLYGLEMGHVDTKELVPFLTKELKIAKKWALSAIQSADLVWEKREILDQKIVATAHSWALNRIQKMELSILRLGTYEIIFDPDIPPAVAISEAIRLSRKFSTLESAKFVNGVLDAILRDFHG